MYTAQALYGATPAAPQFGMAAAPTQAMGTDDIASGVRGLVDPANPLLWFGGLLAVTFGLVGVAGSVRLGAAKVSASVDKA